MDSQYRSDWRKRRTERGTSRTCRLEVGTIYYRDQSEFREIPSQSPKRRTSKANRDLCGRSDEMNKTKQRPTIGILVVLAMIVGSTATLQASGIFKSVKAESKGEEITVVWRTDGEAGYHTFEVERRSSEVPSYRRIGSIVVRGSGGTYSFVDNGAFFKTDADKEFTYRIRAIGGSGVEAYSPTVSVSHRVVSSVKRSWGMIKELFR